MGFVIEGFIQKRRERMGQCPEHGAPLVQVGTWEKDWRTGKLLGCPQEGCLYRVEATEDAAQP